MSDVRPLVLLLVLAAQACAQTEPQPREVDPGPPPSDAVVLFNGKDTSAWETVQGKPIRCTIEGEALACKTGAGDIQSRKRFGDAQIHLEFRIPNMPEQHSQLRGNSGVYLMGRYELQVLDSYRNPTYPTGALGALYGESAPLVNPARKPETWQSYDIIFHAPRCDARGQVKEPGSVTVLLNGVLVQDHTIINEKADQQKGQPCQESGPLRLQDHSGFPGAPVTVMRFRNIWYRPL
jgi:hypothetical protein